MRSFPLIRTIRDPALSLISTPAALNIDFISAHLMSPGAGLVKMRCRVRRCRALIYGHYGTIKWYLRQGFLCAVIGKYRTRNRLWHPLPIRRPTHNFDYIPLAAVRFRLKVTSLQPCLDGRKPKPPSQPSLIRGRDNATTYTPDLTGCGARH